MQRIISALFLALALVLALPCQTPTSIPVGSITAVVSPQGTEAMKQATGYSSKTSALARIDVCNGDQASDHNVSTSRLVSAVVLQSKTPIYSSEVVKAVLVVLQQKDVYRKVSRGISAGANTSILLAALFKTISPLGAALLDAGPRIAEAVLPAISDPRDLIGMAEKILPDNTTLALGRAGSGNDCHTGLLVMMSPTVAIGSVVVQ